MHNAHVENTRQMRPLTAAPAACPSPTIFAAPRIAPSATVPPFTAHASPRTAFKRSTADKCPQRHLRPPVSKYHYITLRHTAGGPRRPCTPPHDPFHPASCAMNTVANRTRERDLPIASSLVRGTRPPAPMFPAQRNGCETFRGCKGSERDVYFGLNKYSRNVH